MSDHISIAVDACSKAIMSGGWSGSPTVDVGKMRRAIEAAVADEREACALIADRCGWDRRAAEEIRARGKVSIP